MDTDCLQSGVNAYDKRYEFRLANQGDIDAIMAFIRDHWKKDHILGTNRPFFDYEMTRGESVNFVMATENGEIQCLHGFIENSLNPRRRDIWGAIWKTINIADNIPLLGLELKRRLWSLTGCRSDNGAGMNPMTARPLLLSQMKYHTDTMAHYYRANPDVKEQRIGNVHPLAYTTPSPHQASLILLSNINQLRLRISPGVVPYKDEWYLDKRYFRHPIYKYRVWGIDGHNAAIVTRKVRHNGSQILRIVDVLGDEDALPSIHSALGTILDGCEYCDLLCCNIRHDNLFGAGFVPRGPRDLLPNHFEPFVAKNIDVHTCSSWGKIRICRADGDQDRPSIVP